MGEIENEAIENLVRTIKEMFSEDTLKIVDFLERANVLEYIDITERIKEKDTIIEKPTNRIEIDYLRLCSDNDFPRNVDMTGPFFLHYQEYTLRNYRASWNMNLNTIESDFKNKCFYCQEDQLVCPMKVLGYIKKAIKTANVDEKQFFNTCMRKENVVYNNRQSDIEMIAKEVMKITTNTLDLAGAEFFLQTEAVTIEKIEEEIIAYRYLDFKVKTYSFLDNVKDYKIHKKGLVGQLSLSEKHFEKNYSYMFDTSPVQLAVYIQYLCYQKSVEPILVFKYLYQCIQTKEPIDKLAYYKEYLQIVDRLECEKEAKKEIKNIFTYIKNYNAIRFLPYIQFNIKLFTQDTAFGNKIINLLYNFANTNYYISNKGMIYVDVNMFIRRAKDSNDVFYQIDKIYETYDFIVFYHFSDLKKMNEYRVEAFFVALEKYYNKNVRTITILEGEKTQIEEAIMPYPKLNSVMINKTITVLEKDTAYIKGKIMEKFKNGFSLDETFEEALEQYIKKTYNPKVVEESVFINQAYQTILLNQFKELGENFVLSANVIPENSGEREIDEILADINQLIGISDVKNTVAELLHYLAYSKKIDTEGFANLNMVFKGNAGTGKTTMARLMAELFYKLGFIKTNKIIEVSSKDLIGDHIGQTPIKTQKIVEEALDGVLFVDEAYSLLTGKGTNVDYGSECIAVLCKAMDLYKDRLIIIFAGYTKEMNDFINKNQGLMSRIGYEIEFPDFTENELWEIFRTEAEGNEFILETGVEEKIRKIIKKNKVGRNFGNARFVENLFDKLVITHGVVCQEEDKLKTITTKDIDKMEETKKDKERSIDDILEDLNALIGLKNVKDVIYGFVSLIEFHKKLDRSSEFNMHMIFKGNAGTGKTTVARLLAEIYYHLGYIKRNKLVEVQAKDLIGEYLGQTGPKTQSVIEEALDGVLFIDEAYSIMEHRGSNASFTDECIATLLKAMEDYQGRLIIIFAGYTEEMKQFRDQNPGLKSRVGFELDFQDYSLEELMQIFDKKLKEKGLTIDEIAREKVKNILKKAQQVENFGNGRFVDNTLQKIIIEHAIQTRKIEEQERLLTITEEDVKDIKAEASRNRIGF